jgi:chaperonin GroEL
MVFSACSEPMKQIAENAGKSGDAVVAKVLEAQQEIRAVLLAGPTPANPLLQVAGRYACWPNFGYNAAKNTYEDMISAGILDPLKAVKEEITNALSVSMLILRTEAVIAEEFEESKQQ